MRQQSNSSESEALTSQLRAALHFPGRVLWWERLRGTALVNIHSPLSPPDKRNGSAGSHRLPPMGPARQSASPHHYGSSRMKENMAVTSEESPAVTCLFPLAHMSDIHSSTHRHPNQQLCGHHSSHSFPREL